MLPSYLSYENLSFLIHFFPYDNYYYQLHGINKILKIEGLNISLSVAGYIIGCGYGFCHTDCHVCGKNQDLHNEELYMVVYSSINVFISHKHWTDFEYQSLVFADPLYDCSSLDYGKTHGLGFSYPGDCCSICHCTNNSMYLTGLNFGLWPPIAMLWYPETYFIHHLS